MITIFDAIRALNPTVVTIRGTDAFDANGNPVTYDATAAQTQLATMQAAEATAAQTAATNKASAIAKLTALGLTADEISALIGVQ
jgi:DNA-directed RNA polymerase specialized sigma24 family protein